MSREILRFQALVVPYQKLPPYVMSSLVERVVCLQLFNFESLACPEYEGLLDEAFLGEEEFGPADEEENEVEDC